jgi:hypothetical protein
MRHNWKRDPYARLRYVVKRDEDDTFFILDKKERTRYVKKNGTVVWLKRDEERRVLVRGFKSYELAKAFCRGANGLPRLT